jgi:two-component system, response regulator
VNSTDKFILLAEDDLVVAELVLHTLANMNPAPKVVHVRDGVEALDFLHARGKYDHREATSPAVVLLDLKMPRLDGLEVLRHVKSDEQLKATPVVMLTSSQDERDIRESYQLGANGYVVKPVEFRKFAFVLQQLESFWLDINHPPPHFRSAAVAAEMR